MHIEFAVIKTLSNIPDSRRQPYYLQRQPEQNPIISNAIHKTKSTNTTTKAATPKFNQKT